MEITSAIVIEIQQCAGKIFSRITVADRPNNLKRVVIIKLLLKNILI